MLTCGVQCPFCQLWATMVCAWPCLTAVSGVNVNWPSVAAVTTNGETSGRPAISNTITEAIASEAFFGRAITTPSLVFVVTSAPCLASARR